MSVLSTAEMERRVANLEAENRELRQALLKNLTEQCTPADSQDLVNLKNDAANLLFALHDAWPYVHGHCTINSMKNRILELIRKHGDFAELTKPLHVNTDELVKAANQALSVCEVFAKLFKQAEALHDGPMPSTIDCQITDSDLRKGLYAAADLKELLGKAKNGLR